MEIDESVPIPNKRRPTKKAEKKAVGKAVYPFLSMSVGDSVLVEDPDEFRRAANAAHMCGARKGWKFMARTLPGGMRIWRTK